MKIELNSIKQFRVAMLLFGVGILLSFACKQATGSLDISEEEPIIEDLNINVKYAESYDQTVVTYSRLWPEGISAGIGKSKNSSSGELLVDYERTREVLAFDEDGYMSTVSEFLEGDGEMNMPEEAYNELKSTMPARSNDYDPVVKTVMEDGNLYQYGKSGNLKYQSEYDPETFRITQAELDSMEVWANTSGDTENSIQNNLLNLSQQNIKYDRVGDYYVSYQIETRDRERKHGIEAYKYVDDLRTGLTKQLIVLRTDGKYDSVIRSMHQIVNRIPVLVSESRYTFGEVNGEWTVAYKQRTTRENINVTRN